MESQGVEQYLSNLEKEMELDPPKSYKNGTFTDWEAELDKDNPPSYITGIDPGFANMGWAKAEYTVYPKNLEIKLKILKTGVHRINNDIKMSVPDMCSASERFFKNIFQSEEECSKNLVVIERQFGVFERQKQALAQGKSLPQSEIYFAQQIFSLWGILRQTAQTTAQMVEDVHPSTVKSRFKTQGSNYDQNKSLAIQFCQNDLKLNINTSHEADAVLLICCYLQNEISGYPTYKITIVK